MSTGAWIFATAALVLAVAAPVSYAAATSTVAIGNTNNNSTAFVDSERQLVTVNGAQPYQIVHGDIGIGPFTCGTVYTPPTGKAVVVTQVTVDLGTGTAGSESLAELANVGCSTAYDLFDTTDAYDAQTHTYPSGVPLSGVSVYDITSTNIYATFTGYLIPAGQLPPAAPNTPKALLKLEKRILTAPSRQHGRQPRR